MRLPQSSGNDDWKDGEPVVYRVRPGLWYSGKIDGAPWRSGGIRFVNLYDMDESHVEATGRDYVDAAPCHALKRRK